MTTLVVRLSFLAAFLLVALGGSPVAQAATGQTTGSQALQQGSHFSADLAKVVLAAHKYHPKKSYSSSKSKAKYKARHDKSKKLAIKKHKRYKKTALYKKKSSKSLKYGKKRATKKSLHKRYKKSKSLKKAALRGMDLRRRL